MSGFLVVLCVLMFGVATLFSMLGQGGGVQCTPVQVFLHRLSRRRHDQPVSDHGDLATLVFRKAHKVDWSLAIVLESVTALGGLIGGLTALGGFGGGILLPGTGTGKLPSSSVLAVAVFIGGQIGARKSIGIEKKKR